jgi:raffinose/stachyose/melibiose transport system substrate-binding protein
MLLVLLGLVAAVLVAVSAASAKPKANVTLKFAMLAETRAPWDVLVANFQRQYPDITIEMSYIPFAQYGSTLLTEYQAGNPPDMMVATAGSVSNYSTWAFASQGKLLDLTGSPWVKRTVPATRGYVTVKHKIYGLPAAVLGSGMVYNVDVFKQLGLTVPKQASDLMTICTKAKAAGKTPFVMGAASLAAMQAVVSNIAVANVYGIDPAWTVHKLQHKTSFASSPYWRAGFNELVTLRDAGCFNAAPAATTQQVAQGMLARGEAVMEFGTQQEILTLKGINPSASFAITPYPSIKASDTHAQISTSAFILSGNATTSHPKEVKTFIDFMGRPKQNSLFAKVGYAIANDDYNKAILPPEVQNFAPYIKAHKTVVTPVQGWPRPEKGLFNPGLTSQIAGLFTGQRTVDQILTNEDALWDAP